MQLRLNEKHPFSLPEISGAIVAEREAKLLEAKNPSPSFFFLQR